MTSKTRPWDGHNITVSILYTSLHLYMLLIFLNLVYNVSLCLFDVYLLLRFNILFRTCKIRLNTRPREYQIFLDLSTLSMLIYIMSTSGSSSIKIRDEATGNSYSVSSHNISSAFSLSKANAITILLLMAALCNLI